MTLAVLFHLYQPVTQSESMFRKIASESYLPLIKILKNKRQINVTLNMPLSLLYQLEKYGYSSVLSDLKELLDSERIELTGSGAYHPLLTRLPINVCQHQIMLNEYALGYYFGKHSGFEGESAILIKDLNGFFPPELNINNELITTLEDFGYKWVLADETALYNGSESSSNGKSKGGVYSIKDKHIKLVVRTRSLSNSLSFKRDLEISSLVSEIKRNEFSVLALDGEYFGHHFTEGLLLLENLIDNLIAQHCRIIKVSEGVEFAENEPVIDGVTESTWGASDINMKDGHIYPFWDDPENRIHAKQWELFNLVAKNFNEYLQKDVVLPAEGFETLPFWIPQSLKKLTDASMISSIQRSLLGVMCFNSDQFWWSSNKTLPMGEILYDTNMVEKSIGLYREYVNMTDDSSLKESFELLQAEIKKLLSRSENTLF